MSQLVKHLKVSAIADGPDPNQVNPSDWNASHVFSGGALGGLLMRDTGDATYGASWLASVAAGSVLISNGVAAAPTWASSLTLGGTLTVAGTVSTGALTVASGNLTVATGNLTISAGALVVNGAINGAGSAIISTALASELSLTVRNTSPASAAQSSFYLGNDASPTRCQILQSSSTYTVSGPYKADQAMFLTTGNGGCTFYMNNTTAGYDWWTSGVSRMRVAASGELLINSLSNPLNGQVWISADVTVHPYGIVLYNVSATNSLGYLLFLNSGLASAGSINQTGAATVVYNTASDARLKDDAGRATDLSALRAVVVHDFTWKADSIRDRGVFAQEALDLYPRAVSEGTDDLTESGTLARPWMTDYSKFVPDLIVGWQHLDAEVAALRAALATLRS